MELPAVYIEFIIEWIIIDDVAKAIVDCLIFLDSRQRRALDGELDGDYSFIMI